MRNLFLTVAALAALGIALPVATTESAKAETVVIKKNRGHHYGWNRHHRDRVVIREHREHRRHHGAAVIVR